MPKIKSAFHCQRPTFFLNPLRKVYIGLVLWRQVASVMVEQRQWMRNLRFILVKVKHPKVLHGPARLTKSCLTRAEKLLDKLLQKGGARRRIYIPFMSRETSVGKFNKVPGKSKVGHLLKTRQKLNVYSLSSLEPKHTHSSGKPEWKPASYFQPFLARQN